MSGYDGASLLLDHIYAHRDDLDMHPPAAA